MSDVFPYFLQNHHWLINTDINSQYRLYNCQTHLMIINLSPCFPWNFHWILVNSWFGDSLEYVCADMFNGITRQREVHWIPCVKTCQRAKKSLGILLNRTGRSQSCLTLTFVFDWTEGADITMYTLHKWELNQ